MDRETPRRRNRNPTLAEGSDIEADGYVDACAVVDIPEKRARIVCLGGERVAIFKYDGRISAVSNVCQHQNGPLGEGKIIDACITCPWHGYQYLPDTGAAPPPFIEAVPTFKVRVQQGRVFVHPTPNPPGERVEPASSGEVSMNAEDIRPARSASPDHRTPVDRSLPVSRASGGE